MCASLFPFTAASERSRAVLSLALRERLVEPRNLVSARLRAQQVLMSLTLARAYHTSDVFIVAWWRIAAGTRRPSQSRSADWP